MRRRVIVIGGGAAGLTAALRLSEKEFDVTLLEQQRELGGRLISPDDKTPRDPTSPVFLRCQAATRSLLETIGTARHVRFSRALGFEFLVSGRFVRLPRVLAPAPVHALLSLLLFQGLSVQDRWRLLNSLERTWEGSPPLSVDLDSQTADALFSEWGQSREARTRIWDPLTRFLLGEGLTTASAALLLEMLKRCFFSTCRGSELAIPDDNLCNLLIEPARQRLISKGVRIHLGTAVTQIRFDPHGVIGVQLQDGTLLSADWYVAAVPHRSLSALLPERVLSRFAYFQQLTRLSDTCRLTADLWIEGLLPARLLLLSERPFHWMVSRPLREGPAQREHRRILFSLVVTGSTGMLEKTDREILDLALGELKSLPLTGHPTRLIDYRVVREPHAFLSVRPGTSALRPLQQSPFPNLLLACDWTDTGLPPSLESAILSGNRCAEAILARH